MRQDIRTLTSGGGGERRKIVAVVSFPPVDILHSQFFTSLRSAMEWGQRCGWDMINLDTWRDKLPRGIRPDGMLIRGARKKDDVEGWHKQIPVGVMIDSAPHLTGPYPIVEADTSMAGHKAAKYFLERRFQHCAVCHYGHPDRSLAITEFEATMRKEGATFDSIVCRDTGTDPLASYARDFKSQISRLSLPIAIFCVNDTLAIRACHWCREMELAVPEQVAILGYGNDVMACRYNAVPISSIDCGLEQVGREAARLLQRLMDGEAAPDAPVRLPVGEVITRRSTDILALPDVDAARALRYIWDHYCENIGVAEIAAACAMSRSKLARLFRTSLDRTVLEELTRLRLRKACDLLTKGDLPVVDIAAQCGYPSPPYFNDLFKRTFAVTPQRFRNRERKARHLAE